MSGSKKGVASFSPEALREKYRLEREKRLRADGNAQYRDLSGVSADFDKDPYVEPGFSRPALTEQLDYLSSDVESALYRFVPTSGGVQP